MFVSNLCVRNGRILSLIDWEELSKIVFHGLIALMVGIWVAGETLGHWVHRLNDWLAHHWVQLIVLQTSVETEQALIIVEEVSTTTLPIVVEVELMLPPTPMVVVDPWYDMSEVEPILPLESLSTFFNTPLMIAAVREPVALLAPELQEQQTPARRRRRQSTQKSPQEVVKPESPLSQLRRPRGRRAHQDKQRARRAGQAA